MSDLSNCKILLVDDTKTNIDILVQTLKDEYKLCVALNGPRAIDYANTNHLDLVLLDILMPGMDGFEVAQTLKNTPATKDIPIIFITAVDDAQHKARGFMMGAVDYITKPFDIREVKARVKTHLTLKIAQEALRNQNVLLEEKVRERTRELEQTQIEIINRLGMAAEYRDEETGQHIKRMSEYCRVLSEAAGLAPEDANIIALSSTMHDAGKIGIPDTILLKPGKLTPEEWEIMKTHTLIGAKLLSGGNSPLMRNAEIIALTHHEKWDGSGYTQGLKGEAIPLAGRIACICDVFDALVSERPYKKAWPVEKAFKEIESCSGTLFDPNLVPLFLKLKNEIVQIMEEWQ